MYTKLKVRDGVSVHQVWIMWHENAFTNFLFKPISFFYTDVKHFFNDVEDTR